MSMVMMIIIIMTMMIVYSKDEETKDWFRSRTTTSWPMIRWMMEMSCGRSRQQSQWRRWSQWRGRWRWAWWCCRWPRWKWMRIPICMISERSLAVMWSDSNLVTTTYCLFTRPTQQIKMWSISETWMKNLVKSEHLFPEESANASGKLEYK